MDRLPIEIIMTPDEAQAIRRAYARIYYNADMVHMDQRRFMWDINMALYATGVFLEANNWKSDVETVSLFLTESERQALERFALACRQFCSIAPGAGALEPALSSVWIKAHRAQKKLQRRRT